MARNRMIDLDLLPTVIKKSLNDSQAFEEANNLETVEQILNYVRNLKNKDGTTDESLQFFILATHEVTVKEYPFLNQHLKDTGLLDYGERHVMNWNNILLEMANRTSGFWKVMPYVSGLLFAITAACISEIKTYSSYRDLSMGDMAAACLGSVSLFGASYSYLKGKKEADLLKSTFELRNFLSPR